MNTSLASIVVFSALFFCTVSGALPSAATRYIYQGSTDAQCPCKCTSGRRAGDQCSTLIAGCTVSTCTKSNGKTGYQCCNQPTGGTARLIRCESSNNNEYYAVAVDGHGATFGAFKSTNVARVDRFVRCGNTPDVTSTVQDFFTASLWNCNHSRCSLDEDSGKCKCSSYYSCPTANAHVVSTVPDFLATVKKCGN